MICISLPGSLCRALSRGFFVIDIEKTEIDFRFEFLISRVLTSVNVVVVTTLRWIVAFYISF